MKPEGQRKDGNTMLSNCQQWLVHNMYQPLYMLKMYVKIYVYTLVIFDYLTYQGPGTPTTTSTARQSNQGSRWRTGTTVRQSLLGANNHMM